MKLHLPVRLLRAVVAVMAVTSFVIQSAFAADIPDGYSQATISDMSEFNANEKQSTAYIAQSDFVLKSNTAIVSLETWPTTHWFVTSESDVSGNSLYSFKLQNNEYSEIFHEYGEPGDGSYMPEQYVALLSLKSFEANGLNSFDITGNKINREQNTSFHTIDSGFLYSQDTRVSSNETVNVCNNSIAYESVETQSVVRGVALGGFVRFSDNTTIIHENNTSTAESGAGYITAEGGVFYGSGVSYTDNGDIRISNNGVRAKGAGSNMLAQGGALSSVAGISTSGPVYGVSFNNNGAIHICGNYAEIDFTGDDSSKVSSTVRGGAIYAPKGKVHIRNNDDVIFEKNYIVKNGEYELQSIYAEDARNNSGILSVEFSTEQGKKIEFRDSIYIDVDLIPNKGSSSFELNSQYTDADGNTIAQTGDIVITGEYAEQHLNEILAARGENRTATAGEILASQTSEILGTAKLHDGRLMVKNGAVLKADALEVLGSASGQSTPTLVLQDATLNTDTLTFEKGTTLEIDRNSTLNVSEALTMAKGSTLKLRGNFKAGDTIVSGTGDIDISEASITLANGMGAFAFDENGNLIITAVFDNSIAEALTVSNWGIATASRTFVNAVRGQRTNTGCIANGRGTAWAAVLGGTSDIGNGDIDLKGAAVGADMKVGEKSSLGVAVGYIDGDAQIPGIRKAEQEGTYVALYGEHGLKKLDSTSCLSLDWVAAYGNTESEWNGMDWEQDSLQLNTRLNWNKKVTDRLCMSVFGGLEYFTSESDRVANAKTGSIQNLRGEIGVGARYVARGTPGTAATYDEKGALVTASRPGCEKLVLHGEIRYMNDLVRSNPVIEQDGLRGSGDNPGRQGMGIEAGATYRIDERWSASANYGFNAMEDSREHRVNVGASYTF